MFDVRFVYKETKVPYDCTVKAEFWRGKEFIAEGLPYSILYFNAVALALISLGHAMDCNKVNSKLAEAPIRS